MRNIALRLSVVFLAANLSACNWLENKHRVEIPYAIHGLNSKEEIPAAIDGFDINPKSMNELSRKIGKSPQEIKDAVNLHFLLSPGTPLTIECTAKLKKEAVRSICEAFGADLKVFLNAHRK